MHDNASIKEQVRERYAEEARRVRQNSDKPSCCGGAQAVSKSKPSCCGSNASACDPITLNLYLDDEKAGMPADAVAASEWFAEAGLDTGKAAPELDGMFMSAFVRARKPA